MIRSDNTPVRSRTIQGEAYEDVGMGDFSFTIPQPFTAEHVAGVEALGANPAGVAQQLNQVLAENLGNNMAARVKRAVKEKTDLPNQADMDSLYESYDFTGLRSSSSVSYGSLFDKLFYKAAGSFLRKLFAKKGYQSMPAPVKVAKRGAEAGDQEIAYEDFETEIVRLVEGEGPWSDNPVFVEVRESLIAGAKDEEASVRAAEAKVEASLSAADKLG